MRFRHAIYVAEVLALAAIYVVAAKIGFSLVTVDEYATSAWPAAIAEQVTPVWPPTGISLVAVLLLGRRIWPGIALGAFLANVTHREPLGTALGIAVGNTLEALLAAWLLRRFAKFDPSLERLRDVLSLIVLAAGLSTMFSATIGVASLCLGGVKPWSAFEPLWWVWWLGDATGDLLMAPVLLTWATVPRIVLARRPIEIAGLAAGVAIVSLLVFVGHPSIALQDHPHVYPIFPVVIWAALRFGQRLTTAVVFLVSCIAIGCTIGGLGPFAPVSVHAVHERLILLQLFMGVIAVTGMLLAAAISERNLTDRRRAVAFAVTQVLADFNTLKEAAPRILCSVGRSLGWDVGGLWEVDQRAGVLRCVEVWQEQPPQAPKFEADSRQRTFASGVGLPGRVWASGAPAWVADVVRDSNFPRAPLAAREGLHGALGFPILLENKVLGVIEFFSHRIRRPDDDLLRMFAAVGSQIGQFLDRKRAEETVRKNEIRLRLALDAGQMGIWDWNVPTGEVWWSDNLEPIHGLAPGTFGGSFEAFLDLVHPDDRAAVRGAIVRAVDAGSDFDIEFRLSRSDGGTRWMAGKGRAFVDDTGRSIRMIGVGMDITRQKRNEEALKESDRRKDEFLAMLAHELRNPLAPIRSAVEILNVAGAEGDQAPQAREVIERQVKQMTRLVDDLLDVSRITRGKIKLQKEPIDLCLAVTNAVETCRSAIDSRGHVLAVVMPPEPVWVEADPARLEQISSNLLTNSIRYTPPNGRIHITVAPEGNEAVLRVRDTGIGIRPEILPRIFDLFTQADRAPDRAQEGLGIGLTLVRSLVEMHGGRVHAASAGPGKGSEFTVRLPLLKDRPKCVGVQRRADSTVERKLRVLVVDDNVDAAHSMAMLLRLGGHAVAIAHDGPEALATAKIQKPEVVFLDIGLPKGMSGYDVARQMRQLSGMDRSFLVAVTGFGQDEDRRRARASGFDLHLTKPVDPEDLRRLLAVRTRSDEPKLSSTT